MDVKAKQTIPQVTKMHRSIDRTLELASLSARRPKTWIARGICTPARRPDDRLYRPTVAVGPPRHTPTVFVRREWYGRVVLFALYADGRGRCRIWPSAHGAIPIVGIHTPLSKKKCT